jgi:DNA-directed RNA polymerase subunit M/transcription elongation factor TFIIS
MTDAERAGPSNGIWLCRTCARLVDADERRFRVETLRGWKEQHEAWIEAGGPTGQPAAREITVTEGGIGGVVENRGSGIGLNVEGAPGQTAERIEVVGRGVGEIVTNTGTGTGKVVRSIGASASESRVTVNQPVKIAAALFSKVAIVLCDACRTQFTATKVIQGLAADEEPKVQINCPHCGHPTRI